VYGAVLPDTLKERTVFIFKFQFFEALLTLEGDGSLIFRNVGIISPRDAASYFRREEYSNIYTFTVLFVIETFLAVN
jgi:hypothetical protein